jgi:FliI/YscN family ATPase
VLNTVILPRLHDAVDRAPAFDVSGRVVRIIGTSVEIGGLPAGIGAVVEIARAGAPIVAEVVGFSGGRLVAVPHGDPAGIAPGAAVRVRRTGTRIPVGRALIGRIVDAFGAPIDGRGPISAPTRAISHTSTPAAIDRARVDRPFWTGVRAIDGFLTAGRGQRLGIFAGSGVGKSSLMAMIARHAAADVNVIAIVGERGREVAEFIDEYLGAEGLARSVVVVATGDQPAIVRLRAAETATAIAEALRDDGEDVLFLMDSVTRYAMAAREIGLGAGEPPVLRGYPASVFSMLPRLIERSGNGIAGSITAFYTVLVEGGDFDEPVSDTVRSILDGHVILSRRLAEANHWPAIDVNASLSRVMPAVAAPEHRAAAGALRSLMAAYEESRDLIEVGAYAAGSNPVVDAAIAKKPDIDVFLRQPMEESTPPEASTSALALLAGAGEAAPESEPESSLLGGER